MAFTNPAGLLTVPADNSASFELGVQEEARSREVRAVKWRVVPHGISVSPAQGTVAVVGDRSTTALRVRSGRPGNYGVTIKLSQGGQPLPSLVLDVDVKHARSGSHVNYETTFELLGAVVVVLGLTIAFRRLVRRGRAT